MSLITTHTHHATLIVHPKRKEVTPELQKELTEDSHAHLFLEQTVIDIDTARSLSHWNNSPYEGNRIALLSFHSITIPAQNALLKVIEEPKEGTRFILITSNKDALLPTLLSRLQEEAPNDQILKKDTTTITTFLAAEPSLRMKLPQITALLSASDEEGRKDREAIHYFLTTLAQTLLNKKEALYAKETLLLASYAKDSSSSGKALLEYLALLLPKQ